MEIIHVAPPFLPMEDDLVYGGIERDINALRYRQEGLGHATYVVAPSDSKTHRLLPTVYSIGLDDIYSNMLPKDDVRKRTYSKLNHVERVMEYSKKHPSAIFHIHDDYLLPFMDHLASSSLLTIHCDYDEFWQAEAFPEMAKRSRNLVALSNRHREILESHGFPIRSVIYNGIDPELFEFREKKDGYLLSLSVIAPHKGQSLAIDVAKSAGKDLVIAGNIGDHDYFNKFKDRIDFDLSCHQDKYGSYRALPSEKQKVVYVGAVNDNQKIPLFSHADAFLMMFLLEEPFGLVGIESLASGTPVIGFDRGATPEIVSDGVTGYLCKDVSDMKKAVRRISSLDRHECRRSVERKFSLDTMTRRYLDLYDDIVSEHSL